jgi:hypothetical protein
MGVDDAKAGALGMCPGCKATFRIPMPGPVSAPPSPIPLPRPVTPPPAETPTAPVPHPAEAPAPMPFHDSTYAIELEPDGPAAPPKRAPSLAEQYAPDEDEDEDEDSPVARRRWQGEGVWTGDLIPGISNFALIMIILGLGWVTLGGLSVAYRTPGLVMLGVGSLIFVVSGAWMLKIAFEESVGTGLACIFIPFYGLMFILSNLDRTGVPAVINLIGGGYIVTAAICLLVRGG